MLSVRFFDYTENEISVPKVLGVSIHPLLSLSLPLPILLGMEHCNSCDVQYIRGSALCPSISTENRLNIAPCDWRWCITPRRDANGALHRDARPRNKHERTFPRVLPAIGLVAPDGRNVIPRVSGSSSIYMNLIDLSGSTVITSGLFLALRRKRLTFCHSGRFSARERRIARGKIC